LKLVAKKLRHVDETNHRNIPSHWLSEVMKQVKPAWLLLQAISGSGSAWIRSKVLWRTWRYWWSAMMMKMQKISPRVASQGYASGMP